MEKLEFEIVTTRVVNSGDLDSFINGAYGWVGKKYQCIPQEQWSNDSSHEIKVKKEELDEYEGMKLEQFKQTGAWSFGLNGILTDLCNKDLIEPGEYTIRVCW